MAVDSHTLTAPMAGPDLWMVAPPGNSSLLPYAASPWITTLRWVPAWVHYLTMRALLAGWTINQGMALRWHELPHVVRQRLGAYYRDGGMDACTGALHGYGRNIQWVASMGFATPSLVRLPHWQPWRVHHPELP